MIILISCAKTMGGINKVIPPFTSTPLFNDNAKDIINKMSSYSAEEISKILKINLAIAKENLERYKNFNIPDNLTPALLSYTGIVFKKINAQDFTASDFEFAQKPLRITSFAYGLLKPLDLKNNIKE